MGRFDRDPMIRSAEQTIGGGEGRFASGGHRLQPNAQRAVGRLDVDGAGAIRSLGEGVTEKFEEQAERVVIERTQVGEATATGLDETLSGAFNLHGLLAGDFAQTGFFDGAVDDRGGRPARGSATVLAQARREPDRRPIKPARAGILGAKGPFRQSFGIDAKVAGRHEGEGGAPEPVTGRLIGSLGEPVRKGGEISGAVGAA